MTSTNRTESFAEFPRHAGGRRPVTPVEIEIGCHIDAARREYRTVRHAAMSDSGDAGKARRAALDHLRVEGDRLVELGRSKGSAWLVDRGLTMLDIGHRRIPVMAR